jgi:hypothetical protein
MLDYQSKSRGNRYQPWMAAVLWIALALLALVASIAIYLHWSDAKFWDL